MEADALIDLVLNYTDNINPTDANYANRRTRTLQYIQEAFDETYNFRDWGFRYTTGGFTLNANATSAVLPVNFGSFGDNGGLYRALDSQKFVERNTTEVTDYRESINNQAGGSLPIFALVGNTVYMPAPLANTSFRVYYLLSSPVLVDSGTNSGLTLIPAQYHNTVLLPCVIAKTRKSKGDSRDFRSEYTRGLAVMVARERTRKTSILQWPSAVSNW